MNHKLDKAKVKSINMNSLKVTIALQILLMFNISSINSQSYRCSKNFELVSDLSQNDCPPKHYYKENLDDCFPGCYKVDDNWATKKCTENSCPPGYYCHKTIKKCKVDENSCAKYYTQGSPYYGAHWTPDCLKSGKWAPKQCKGEMATGRCYCYDAVGKRLFGHAWEKDSADMTCACSRKRADMLATGKYSYINFHCDSMGNYEKLQCDSGLCWCVDPKTGEVTDAAVPESLMLYLPCYSKSEIGSQYLRECESQKFAQAKILEKLQKHGTQRVNIPDIRCDGDGAYGVFQVGNGIAYCTWRDNTRILSYQIGATEMKNMNCNCARDVKIYEESGLTLTLLCEANGNYQQMQQIDDKFYCVDSDGFTKSPLFDDSKLLDCTTYM